MNWIKGLIAKLIGKNLQHNVDGILEKFHISKAKVAFFLAGLVKAVPAVGEAYGHPIPPQYIDWAYKFLVAVGLWAVRDAMPPEQPPTPIP